MKTPLATRFNDWDKIENYELAKADNFIGWVIHHRLENEYSSADLRKMNLYLRRPADELIYIRKDEHDLDARISICNPSKSKWHKRINSKQSRNPRMKAEFYKKEPTK